MYNKFLKTVNYKNENEYKGIKVRRDNFEVGGGEGGGGGATIFGGQKLFNTFAANVLVMEKPGITFALIKYLKNTYGWVTF